jgi:hypothetical protein
VPLKGGQKLQRESRNTISSREHFIHGTCSEKQSGRKIEHTAKKIPFMYSHFPEKELRGLSPNFHLPLSVSDLCTPRIGPYIFLQQNRQTDPGNIYIAHRHMNVEIGTVSRTIPFLGIFVSYFRHCVFAVHGKHQKMGNLVCVQARGGCGKGGGPAVLRHLGAEHSQGPGVSGRGRAMQ